MTYPGGKGGSGIPQFIINRIPPHKVYIEGCLGGGTILKSKKPAQINIGIDKDPDAIAPFLTAPEYRYHRDDGCQFYFFTLDFFDFGDRIDKDGYKPQQRFIYLDPPYLKSTRKRTEDIYKFEMTRAQHEELLKWIRTRSEMIMISGYHSELYAEQLADWRCDTFQTITRGGSLALEHFWMNYPEPTSLHDYSFLGENFTDRQRIKRKIQRLNNKLGELPILERSAVITNYLEQLPAIERAAIIASLETYWPG